MPGAGKGQLLESLAQGLQHTQQVRGGEELHGQWSPTAHNPASPAESQGPGGTQAFYDILQPPGSCMWP